MNLKDGRKLILATVVSLCPLAVCVLFAAPAALAEQACPNPAARQGPSAALPDCRAYEQLTPVDKGDSSDLFAAPPGNPIRDRGYAAADGDSFLLSTFAANFDDGASGNNTYVFTRGPGGWTTTPIVPFTSVVQSIDPTVVNPETNFAEVPVRDVVGSNAIAGSGAEESAFDQVNLIGPSRGPFAALDSESGPGVVEGTGDEIAGASADMSHVVLEGFNHELATGDSGQDSASKALDEWVRAGSGGCSSSSATFSVTSGGCVELVNMNNDGSLVSACGAVLGANNVSGGAYSAVASDGSKVFFTSPDPGGEGSECWNPETAPQTDPPQLYMRVNGTTTVDISGEPEAGVSDPTLYPAVFAGASANGAHVFFLTRTELTADDTAHGLELYEYNTEPRPGEKTLIRISRGESGVAEGNVDFVAAISSEEGPEGIQVYFTAFGQLAPAAQALKEEPNQDQVNLYRYSTGTEQTHYIATIDAKEYPMTQLEQTRLWYDTAHGVNSGVTPESGNRAKTLGLDPMANWYTTADGQYLLFSSYQALTGYDNLKAPGSECTSLEPGSGGGRSVEYCAELYRYDAADGSVVCVSCGPPGVAQVDDAEFARSALEKGNAPPPRAISEDGSYVFFDTANALAPNARSGLRHVYEWHEGTISLISSVNDPDNAYYLGSSADGSDVFFGTHAQLVPQDTDQSADLYDARIDGGFGTVTPPVCTGTGCQGAPAAPPIFATPSSVTFEGVGNFPPSSPTPVVNAKAKVLTKAQKLKAALKACERYRAKRKRTSCKAKARAKYAKTHRSVKSNRGGK